MPFHTELMPHVTPELVRRETQRSTRHPGKRPIRVLIATRKASHVDCVNCVLSKIKTHVRNVCYKRHRLLWKEQNKKSLR